MGNYIMKYLAKLEKNKVFWLLLGLSLLFFLLRIPSLIEPNWYGDEGIYQVIGKALKDGRKLYTEIWDNKPPILYIVYAIFNGDQFLVRTFSLLIGILTLLLFYKLAIRILINHRASIISTFIFTVLLATPVLEGNIANAENFLLAPIITAGIIIYGVSHIGDNSKKLNQKLILAGFLLGLAFMLKTVAIFDFLAFFLFIIIFKLPQNTQLRKLNLKFYKFRIKLHYLTISELKKLVNKSLLHYIIAFLIPVFITALYFISNNNFYDFASAVFLSNINYVGVENKLLFPQGLLIFKIIALLISIYIIFLKRNSFSKSQIFVLIWFVVSIFNTNFSGRPYTHYTLLLLPSWTLLIGLLFTKLTRQIRYLFIFLLVTVVIFVNNIFKPDVEKSIKYYDNALAFIFDKKDIITYREFFDYKTTRDYEVASFIKSHTNSTERILIWGDNPQIYILSEKLPVGKYTVSYHIYQNDMALNSTYNAIVTDKPKYIIILNEARSFPFSLSNYSPIFLFSESIVYERYL